MNRRLFGLMLLGAAALVVSACSTSDVAATVNETEITNGEVVALRSDAVTEVIQGDPFRSDLTVLIVTQATVDAAEEEFGVTGFDTADGRVAFLSDATPEELAILESVGADPVRTPAAVDVVITQLAVRSVVIDEILRDPQLLAGVWQDQQETFVEVCARHILVATEAEAIAAKARIDAGEPFSAVANEVSLDTVSVDGQLPCPSSPANFVEPFGTVVASTQIGVVTEPFETEFGWHVVIVDDRVFPATFEEFVAEADRWVPQEIVQRAWTAWRDDALGRADIAVRSQIGRWFPAGDGILPPPDSPNVGDTGSASGS